MAAAKWTVFGSKRQTKRSHLIVNLRSRTLREGLVKGQIRMLHKKCQIETYKHTYKLKHTNILLHKSKYVSDFAFHEGLDSVLVILHDI